MFLHNYLYRLKCIVRDKQVMFWTFIFPIILATLFNIAFSNISSAENFSNIKIGIVDNEEYRENTEFIKAIDAVTNSNKSAGKTNLFDMQYILKEDADKLIENSKIEGYIHFDDGIKLVVNESGINQTIIKSFLDDYKQTYSTVATIISQNPTAIQNGLLDNILDRSDYLKEVTTGKSDANNVVVYFYSLIAMSCLFGGFLGLKEVSALQANLSPQGARVSMAPTHKLKLFIASMFAATTVQLAVIFTLLVYLMLILKVSFGNQLGYIALTCIIGTITGVGFGTFISSLVKKSDGVKIAILVVLTNVMSMLSGMMYHKMKYTVSTKAPILAYINPANLISDSFYSLYYYDTYSQFYTNIALLCGFATGFILITYLILRRQKYDSL